MLDQIISNGEKNLLLFQSHINVYREYQQKRTKRKNDSFMDYIKLSYPKGNTFLPLLSELHHTISKLQEAKSVLTLSIEILDMNIAMIQLQIDNNQYITESSPEYADKIAYENYKNAFVWPTQEELSIRSQEEQELLAFLEQNN